MRWYFVVNDKDALERVGKLAEAYWRIPESNFLLHGPIWRKEHWADVTALDELKGFSWDETWGSKITRDLIQKQWRDAQFEIDALHAFFLTMAWGFGRDRFGPWKVGKMFESLAKQEKSALYLLRLRDEEKQRPSSAFESLLNRKINHLGPVYASKLAYAIAPDGDRTPVMDMWIERWGDKYFEGNFSVNFRRSLEENIRSMVCFKEFCHNALEEIKKRKKNSRPMSENDPGFVEYLIFWDAKYEWRRKWQKQNNFEPWIWKFES